MPGHALVAVELRLGERAHRVDSSFRLASPEEARGVAEEVLPGDRPFLRRWGLEPGLGYPKPVSATWLEFDFDGASGGHAGPLLCARLEGRTDADWLVDVLFPSLCGKPLSSPQAQAIRRALAVLPRGAHLLYAFSLRPRVERAVRLEVFGLDASSLIHYLERAASSALAAEVATLAPLFDGADRYHVAFDIEDEVLPRVGFECGWRRLPHREPRWRRALDRLVAAGLASARKRDAVLAWPGYDSLWSAPSLWPEGAVGRGGFLVRCLSHLKLVASPGRAPEAKAYLLFQHVLRPGQEEGPSAVSKPSSSASFSASRE